MPFRFSEPAPAAGLAALLAIAACAGEPGDFERRDDPGGGTRTLAIAAEVIAVPGVANGGDPSTFRTQYVVRVVKDGERIAVASVIVANVADELALRFDTRDGGVWVGELPGYHAVQRLDVVVGPDQVTGVRAVGPDVHTFTAPNPAMAAAVDPTTPLAVAWQRAEAADRATIQTRRSRRYTIDDTGAFELGPDDLTSRPDQPSEETITLDRSHTVVPAGAAAASTFTVTVRNELKLVVQPIPPPPSP